MMILMEAAVAGAAALQCCGQWQLADDEVAMENEVASKVDPQRGQSVRSDIAIVTTLSPVTCMYIYSSLSLHFFFAVGCKSRACLERCRSPCTGQGKYLWLFRN
jgi:hypothetical protein